MTTNAETGVDELDPTTTEGDDSNGVAGQERMVPLSVVKALRKSNDTLKTQLARVEGAVEGLKAGQQKPPAPVEKTYTRSELRAMVNAGSISEDQMDSVLETQAEKRVAAKAEALVEDRITETRSTSKIEAEIERYVEAHPDVNEEGSDTRERVAAQFKKLVARGLPASLSTELTDMEMALGAIDAPKGRKKTPESHAEVGSGGRAPAPDDDGMFKGVPPKQKAYYQKQIDRGFYKGAAGQKQLKAELDVARARH